MNIFNIILYLVFIIFGIVIGKFFTFPFFEISKEIDLVNVSTILVTILLALLFTHYFDKQKTDYRIEKDIILKRVEEFYQIVEKMQNKCVTGNIPYSEAAFFCKRLYLSVKYLQRSILLCHFSVDNNQIDSITKQIRNLKDILTDTTKLNINEISDTDLPTEVKEGVINFNNEQINKIEKEFDLLKSLFLDFEIMINKK